ncbi:hypothetical protein A6U97_27845 [Agrobacterium tumefaciens]|nr:hypothetical protein A6U97_27845 [Agrobacterium tumefaciens]
MSCSLPWNTKIVIITTEKEGCDVRPTTGEVVEAYIQSKDHGSISRVHYPNSNGWMAHQLNYAIRQLIETEALRPDDVIALYNADSRPHPLTFVAVEKLMKDDTGVAVVQQSAIFLKNYLDIRDWIARADALYQSYWTLVHEITRIRSLSKQGFLSKILATHCVGHGLFIRVKALQEVGYFPEDTVTEDSFLGFLLNSHGIAVHSLPLLEGADAPSSWRAVARQKYVWFFGPLCYPLYLFLFYRSHRELKLSLVKPILFALHGATRAVRWIGKGPLIIALVAYAATVHQQSLIYISIIIGLWTIYAMGPVVFLYGCRGVMKRATGHTIQFPKQSPRNLLKMCGAALVYPALHSLPPFLSIFALLKKITFETAIAKPKTED